jgi:hypothetical protein
MNSEQAQSLLGSQPPVSSMPDPNQLIEKTMNDILNKHVTDDTLKSFSMWAALDSQKQFEIKD